MKLIFFWGGGSCLFKLGKLVHVQQVVHVLVDYSVDSHGC